MIMSARPHIVCIDDDDRVRDSLERLLADEYGEQFEVSTAASGEEGLELVAYLSGEANDVAVVLCDQRMPGLDGIETLSIIKERYPFIKRALLTAYGHDVELVKQAISKAHVDEFMDKPLDPPDVKIFPFVNRMIAQYEIALQREQIFDELMESEKFALKDEAINPRSIGFGDLWAFYLDTNFIYHSKSRALEPYMPEISETWRNLLQAPDLLNEVTLRYRKGIARNSLALTKFHNDTWLVHHMVSNRDPIGMVAVLLDAMEWLTENPAVKYIKFFWRPNNPQPNQMFGGMAEQLSVINGRVHHCALMDYYILPINEQEAPGKLDNNRVKCHVLEEDDNALAVDWLKDTQDPLIFSADAFDIKDPHLEETNSEFEQFGLYRKRDLIAAELDGQLVGLAAAHRSSLGLNLSYYYNMLQVYSDASIKDPRLEAETIQTLVAAGSRVYREQGRDFMVIMCDSSTRNHLAEIGLEPTKQYWAMTLNKEFDGPQICYDHVESFYRSRLLRRKNRERTGDRLSYGA